MVTTGPDAWVSRAAERVLASGHGPIRRFVAVRWTVPRRDAGPRDADREHRACCPGPAVERGRWLGSGSLAEGHDLQHRVRRTGDRLRQGGRGGGEGRRRRGRPERGLLPGEVGGRSGRVPLRQHAAGPDLEVSDPRSSGRRRSVSVRPDLARTGRRDHERASVVRAIRAPTGDGRVEPQARASQRATDAPSGDQAIRAGPGAGGRRRHPVVHHRGLQRSDALRLDVPDGGPAAADPLRRPLAGQRLPRPARVRRHLPRSPSERSGHPRADLALGTAAIRLQLEPTARRPTGPDRPGVGRGSGHHRGQRGRG